MQFRCKDWAISAGRSWAIPDIVRTALNSHPDHLRRLLKHLYTLSKLDSAYKQVLTNPEPFGHGKRAHIRSSPDETTRAAGASSVLGWRVAIRSNKLRGTLLAVEKTIPVCCHCGTTARLIEELLDRQ